MKRLAWGDARYVRLYTDDHPDWTNMSFDAQSLYMHLRRKADRAGMLPLGLDGLRDLPGLIGHAAIAERLMPAFAELIRKGFMEVGETHAIIPEFIESENAFASPASRKRKERETRRDVARLSGMSRQDVTPESRQMVTPSVTPRDTIPQEPHVTPGRHARTSRQDVTPESHKDVTQVVTIEGHAGSHDRRSPSSFQISTDQIPPISPPVGNGGDIGGGFAPIHDDPNLEDIRQKLMGMGKPLCYLPAVRAEERLYAPVMGGALTTAHVLAAIDDAAVSLGPDLGAVQPDDKQGLAALERFVAGCVKRARRDRHTTSASPPVTPRAMQVQPARPTEPGPEALDVLDRFREQYTSVGNYDRFVAGPSDPQLAAEVVAECKRHAGESDDWRDFMMRAIEAYMRDDFYANQGHTMRRFVAVLKTEPTRFIGRRRPSTEQQRADEQARKEHLYFLRSAGLLEEGEEPPPMPLRVRRPVSDERDERDATDHLYKQALAELGS